MRARVSRQNPVAKMSRSLEIFYDFHLMLILASVQCLAFARKDGLENVLNENDWSRAFEEHGQFWKNYSNDSLCSNRTDRGSSMKRCRCDDDCWKYSDCCLDKARHFWRNNKFIKVQNWSCEFVPTKETLQMKYVYMVSRCPSTFLNINISSKCQKLPNEMSYSHLLDIPVISITTNIFYVNIFCALCNNDTKLYDVELKFNCNVNVSSEVMFTSFDYKPKERKWNLTSGNAPIYCEFSVEILNFSWNKLINIFGRTCTPAIDECMTTYNSDSSFMRKMCTAFSSIVQQSQFKVNLLKAPTTSFKNLYCGLCNQVRLDELNIKSLSTSRVQNVNFTSLPIIIGPTFTRSVNLTEILNNCCLYKSAMEDCIMCMVNICTSENNNTEFENFLVENNLPPFNRHRHYVVGTTDELDNIDTSMSEMSLNCTESLLTDFVIFNDSSVFDNVTQKIYSKNEYRFYNETTLFICNQQRYIRRTPVIICSITTVVCLLIYILLHLAVPFLRPQKKDNLVHVACVLLTEQLLFALANLFPSTTVCEITAVAINVCFIVTLAWINLSSVNTLSSLNKKALKKHPRQYYSSQYGAYLWVLPGILILSGIALSRSAFIYDTVLITPSLNCWVREHRLFLIFINLPVVYFLLGNAVFLALTAKLIYCSKHGNEFVQHQLATDQFLSNFNLSLLKGLTWILVYVGNLEEFENVWFASVVLNAAHGLAVLVTVAVRRNLRNGKLLKWLPNKSCGRKFLSCFQRKQRINSKTIPLIKL